MLEDGYSYQVGKGGVGCYRLSVILTLSKLGWQGNGL